MLSFRHNKKDAWLVILSLTTLTVEFMACIAWRSGEELLAVLWIGLVPFLICTNYQCVSHNFIHNPFFRQAWANRLFSVINTPALGVPQTLYKYHHLNHHQYNNDAQDPQSGLTLDQSSIYRHSKDRTKPEGILAYSLKGVWRSDFSFLLALVVKRGESAKMWWEVLVLLLFFISLIALAPFFALFFVIPAWYLGQSLALAENYLEHYGADPFNALANSVSCYDRFYNLIWFNNGYHQEHHYKPSMHWTLIPSQRLPDGNRRIVRYCHIATLFLPPMPWSQRL